MTQDMYIYRTQKALYCLRRFSGWSMGDLGDMLGVTRQTIMNWEKGHAPFQRLQYMGVMTALQVHIMNAPDTSQLTKYTLEIIYNDTMSDDDFMEIIDKLKLVARQSSYDDMLTLASLLLGDDVMTSSYKTLIDPNSDFYRWVSTVMQV